jgi:hypothetical protein
MEYIMAGVATVDLIDPSSNALIVTTKTLTESGLNMSVSSEEIRGSTGNVLLGKYYHTSKFDLTLTDPIFDLEYLALNAGSSITAGGDIMKQEQITATAANSITVSTTPVELSTLTGIVGWYKVVGASNDAWTMCTFNATTKTATVTGVAQGNTVCVKYFISNSASRTFVVSSSYIPATVHAYMRIPLFQSGATSQSFSSSSQVGEIQVDIPKFQLSGSENLAMKSNGAATTSLSGSALANFGGTQSCNDTGYYAIITENIYNKDTFANVTALAVADGDIDLLVNGTQTLQVYAIYNDGTVPTLIDNTLLTFVSSAVGNATVTSEGVVTGVQAGTANIEITVADYTNLGTYAVVTVTTA